MKVVKCFRSALTCMMFWMTASAHASCMTEFEVEAKVSAFLPSSKIVRNIFSDVMPFYDLEIAKPFCCNWKAWLGVGYVGDNGKSIGCRNKTSFSLIPVTLGLKYSFCFYPCLDLYAGAGICWSFFNNKDHSSYVHKNISDNAPGGIFKLGVNYRIQENVFIDIISEYLYQRFSFKHHYEDHYTIRHDVNLSGFKIGAGVGYQF